MALMDTQPPNHLKFMPSEGIDVGKETKITVTIIVYWKDTLSGIQ